jgi:hypothetical protein
MRVITVRNVIDALPAGIQLLKDHGVDRDSRGGAVRQCDSPVTTVYERPWERVLFYPERDANPFFHLYESLWMLAGRSDVAPLMRYAKRMGEYADEGVLHGAYGYRWRRHFLWQHRTEIDQLAVIAERLRKNPTDRQCVLQMWDVNSDLGQTFKDLPCNTIATFQRNSIGELELTIFCRSNDIIWGAYGANAVHFSILHEYMATWIGCPLGRMFQVSVNYHAYTKVLEPIKDLVATSNPYVDGHVKNIPMPYREEKESADEWVQRVDGYISSILTTADEGFINPYVVLDDEWAYSIYVVLYSHHLYKTKGAKEAFDMLEKASIPHNIDWIVAAGEWLARRIK